MLGMKRALILIGGGGHARSCIDVIEEEGVFSIVGILDIESKVGSDVLGHKIIGTESMIKELVDRSCSFLITVGQISNANTRIQIWNLLKSYGANIAIVKSPYATISRYAKIGEGTIIMHGARVNANAVINDNCIINTNAIIEHDVIIGSHNHISTQSVVNGDCKIGNGVFIGSGSIINQGIKVADNVKIGAATLINKNITEPGTYVGIPFFRIA